MKSFYFLFLVLLTSCSAKQEKVFAEVNIDQEVTYFEKIFKDTTGIFNGYNLGDTLDSEINIRDSIIKNIHFDFVTLMDMEKINQIHLNIYPSDSTIAKKLMKKIIHKYNSKFDKNKPISSFVTWRYTTTSRSPGSVILIYNKDKNWIQLDIGYASQR